MAITLGALITCSNAYTALLSSPPRLEMTPQGGNLVDSRDLGGRWRFALDPTDSGVNGQWFNRPLPYPITLPGILQSQDFGDEISTSTPWVLSLYDRFWYLRDDYKPYIQPRTTRVPFLSQPPRHYLGAAWYQRDIDIRLTERLTVCRTGLSLLSQMRIKSAKEHVKEGFGMDTSDFRHARFRDLTV